MSEKRSAIIERVILNCVDEDSGMTTEIELIENTPANYKSFQSITMDFDGKGKLRLDKDFMWNLFRLLGPNVNDD